ncbi:hypothetical protein AOL_s00193g160 [Orbilia oligospora ATCC 24927]|uniref:Uncharacterized protein n=2 Tax=Orbilia oligospora TaxID=2813651 RepID=G1XRG1_ARTOA|nr:hypothetical protein AOL_s00193g160 [Orbilia oligospora ATCC 24927]EGX44248.1 hypothetical protein AOL_s00193g160 [Orbilia oligospora ATCC 24927]KAF3276641.1 hypothetical protein TWF970_006224 [Orbilia oligospora]
MLHTFSGFFLSTLLLGSTVNGVVIPNQDGHQLEKRTGSSGCNADNLLRLIRGQDNLPQGLEFCSTWLGKVHTTITLVGETITPTITNTEVSSTTSTDLSTEISTITNTAYTTVTNTQTFTETQETFTFTKFKHRRIRAATARPLSDQILSNTYPASRISSACNCLTLQPPTTATVYSTETAAPVTSVVVVPALTETSITITDFVSVTTTITSEATKTVTKTVWDD